MSGMLMHRQIRIYHMNSFHKCSKRIQCKRHDRRPGLVLGTGYAGKAKNGDEKKLLILHVASANHFSEDERHRILSSALHTSRFALFAFLWCRLMRFGASHIKNERRWRVFFRRLSPDHNNKNEIIVVELVCRLSVATRQPRGCCFV